MKLFLLLVLVFPIKLFAMDYYIVPDNSTGLPVIIGRNTPPETYLFTAPKDDNGKFVQTMDDVTIITGAIESCIPIVNCAEKLQTICMEISEDGIESKIPNSMPVDGAVSVSCAVAGFDSNKRIARLQALEGFRQEQQEKRNTTWTRLDNIRVQCPGATGLLKLICEHISGL